MTDIPDHRDKRTPNPLRNVLARNRAQNRGPVPCGVPGCRHTFGNERNAEQHRLHKHGIKNGRVV